MMIKAGSSSQNREIVALYSTYISSTATHRIPTGSTAGVFEVGCGADPGGRGASDISGLEKRMDHFAKNALFGMQFIQGSPRIPILPSSSSCRGC
jgi:hypothetical protein